MPLRDLIKNRLQHLLDFVVGFTQKFEPPNRKALKLLKETLPDNAWADLRKKGYIEVRGSNGTYRIKPNGKTVFCYDNRPQVTRYCIIFEDALIPDNDRIFMEYCFLTNDELLYKRYAYNTDRAGS